MPENDVVLAFAQETARSGDKYRSEILEMPYVTIEPTVNRMTYVAALQGKETSIYMKSDAQFKPYSNTINPSQSTTFGERTLETFHAHVTEDFDPMSAYRTIFHKPLSVGRINMEISKKINMGTAKAVSESLVKTIWKGRRNAAGGTALDICDGFDTIINDEKAAGRISVANGNYFQLGNLTVYNIVDKMMLWWRRQDPKFKAQNVNLWVPEHIIEMYQDGFAIKFPTQQYNTTFDQMKLHGSHGRVSLTSAVGMEDNDNIFMTPKFNTRVGGDFNSFKVKEIDNPTLVRFYMECFFGVNFVTLTKEYFTCASVTAQDSEPLLTWGPESIAFGNVSTAESKTLTVHFTGESITSTLAVTVTGSGFSCATSTVTAASANAEAGFDLSVVFAPSATGDKTGNLNIASATDGIDIDIPLSGKGVTPTIAVTTDKASVAFEDTVKNTTKTATVNVKGVALTAALTVAVVGDGEITCSPASITAANANAAAGADITLTFAPTAAGAKAAVLRITSSTDGIDISIPVIGTGLAS